MPSPASIGRLGSTAAACRLGFERSLALWRPLREWLGQLAVEPATAAMIRDTRREIARFGQFSGYYAYTFHALRAAA